MLQAVAACQRVLSDSNERWKVSAHVLCGGRHFVNRAGGLRRAFVAAHERGRVTQSLEALGECDRLDCRTADVQPRNHAKYAHRLALYMRPGPVRRAT